MFHAFTFYSFHREGRGGEEGGEGGRVMVFHMVSLMVTLPEVQWRPSVTLKAHEVEGKEAMMVL